MTTVHLRLHEWGAFHATRYAAGKISATLEGEGEVIVDLAGVQAMTLTFADELFGNLAVDGRRLILSGANEDVFDTVNQALRRRGLEEGWEWVA